MSVGATWPRPPRTRRAAGFTLIEMLAVVLLTGIVMTVAVNFYLQLSRRSARAADLTRDARHAVAVLDRIARDLEGSTLVTKPEALDPLEHPWLFLAESANAGSGADRLKFMTRSHVPGSDDPAETDLQVVSWMLAADANGGLVLRRAASNQMPEGLDRSFPDDADSVVVARGLASFGVRLLDENGEWKTSWDSSTVVESSTLPLAAEIELAFAPGDDVDPLLAGETLPTPYLRRVVLPLRPIDLEAMLKPKDAKGKKNGKDGKDDEDTASGGMTVSQCLARSPALAIALAGVDPNVLASVSGQPAASVAASQGVPLPPECQ